MLLYVYKDTVVMLLSVLCANYVNLAVAIKLGGFGFLYLYIVGFQLSCYKIVVFTACVCLTV